MSAAAIESPDSSEAGKIPGSLAPLTPEVIEGLPFLAAIETNPRQMSDEDLARLVAYAFTKISEVIPYISELRRRFAEVPRGHAHSVEEIRKTGLSTPNVCGSYTQESVPNQFVVFARPQTFWEKMRG